MKGVAAIQLSTLAGIAAFLHKGLIIVFATLLYLAVNGHRIMAASAEPCIVPGIHLLTSDG